MWPVGPEAGAPSLPPVRRTDPGRCPTVGGEPPTRGAGRRRRGGWAVSGARRCASRAPPTAAATAHDALLFDTDDRLVDVAVPVPAGGAGRRRGGGRRHRRRAPPTSCATPSTAIRGCTSSSPRRRLPAPARPRPSPPSAGSPSSGRPRARRRVRVVGEVDFGPTERDWLEWQRYEAVINQALAAWPLWGLCVFDTQRLPDPVLESALRTHSGRRDHRRPGAATRSSRRPRSTSAAAAGAAPSRWRTPRRGSPRSDVTDFIGLRHAVAAELATVDAPRDADRGLPAGGRRDELQRRCGTAGRRSACGCGSSADRLVCTIADRGPGWDDPFAGYGPAHGEDLSRGGMGLWLARQLCDHVDITTDGDGTRVRLTLRLG